WSVMTAALADGVDDLKQFYQSTQAMRANFKQTVFDQKGRKLQEVNGTMLLQRPNKFRWDYQKPYEQQIISDGRQSCRIAGGWAKCRRKFSPDPVAGF
ncbi:conserved hypothetical protein, partial [Ricinus communis]